MLPETRRILRSMRRGSVWEFSPPLRAHFRRYVTTAPAAVGEVSQALWGAEFDVGRGDHCRVLVVIAAPAAAPPAAR